MSSRSQDSAKLAELATQLESQANNLNLAAELLTRYNEAINALEQRVIELEQANDDLERRLMSLEAYSRAQAAIDLLPHN
jgi:exonuclease VII small subunit